MKQAKRITLFLLALVLIMAFGTARAEAAEVFRQGTCGENLTWVLTDDGTLTISGTTVVPSPGKQINPQTIPHLRFTQVR